MKSRKSKFLALVSMMMFFSYFLSAKQLYVEANYHPHDDKNIEKIKTDIELMKAAGFLCCSHGAFGKG